MYVVNKVFNNGDMYYRLIHTTEKKYSGYVGTINGIYYGWTWGTKEHCLEKIGNAAYIDEDGWHNI